MTLPRAILLALAAILLLAGGSALAQGDRDQDLVSDEDDNCAALFNPDQEDSDEDGAGNTCDPTHGVPADESRVVFYLRDEVGNPVGDACFELTEVAPSGPLEPIELCAEPVPGFVSSDLTAPATEERVQQTERPPMCAGGLASTYVHRFQGGSWRVVQVRYRCAGAPRAFADTFTAPGQTRAHTVAVATAKTARILVRWTNRRHRFDVKAIKLVRRSLASGERLKPGRLKITKKRRPTSVDIRLARLKPGRLSFQVQAKAVSGEARVTTRVTQSR